MEAVGSAEDVFYEEEEEVSCYDFEPLPTLLEDEVSEAGAGTEPPPPPLRSPVLRRPQGRPAAPPPPPAASPSFRPRCEGSPPAAPGPGHDWSPGAHPPHRERPGRVDVAVRFPCVRRGFPAFSCAVIPATRLGLVHPRAPSLHNSKVMVLERVLTPVVAVG